MTPLCRSTVEARCPGNARAPLSSLSSSKVVLTALVPQVPQVLPSLALLLSSIRMCLLSCKLKGVHCSRQGYRKKTVEGTSGKVHWVRTLTGCPQIPCLPGTAPLRFCLAFRRPPESSRRASGPLGPTGSILYACCLVTLNLPMTRPSLHGMSGPDNQGLYQGINRARKGKTLWADYAVSPRGLHDSAGC